jgi:hypothetical protein
VPKDIPAKQFWSLTVYDRATWGFINNPLDRAGLGSFNKDKMKLNDDGSVDLYFGAKAPADLESNWIPTMGKEPYIWLRLYGPEEAFWKKTLTSPRGSERGMHRLRNRRIDENNLAIAEPEPAPV